MDLAKLLNPEQLKAVEATEGPVLILAGAGSGKTRVITYRVAHLVENRQVRPEQILAVTFTNKAADQMKYRVRNLLRAARSGDPLISTWMPGGKAPASRPRMREMSALPKRVLSSLR